MVSESLLAYNRGENRFWLYVAIALSVFFTIYFIKRFIKSMSGSQTHTNKSVTLILLEGLNIPQGTKLMCYITNERVAFTNSDLDISLSIKSIISVIKSEIEVSSKGISFKNAIIGGALFGQMGAAIGAFKGKDSEKIGTVVISYEDKNGEIKDITLMPNCLVRGTFNIIDARNELKYFYSKINEIRNSNTQNKKIIKI